MKKLIIFTGIILGIIFFIQCNKTTEIKDYPNDNLESRTESALTNADIQRNKLNEEKEILDSGLNPCAPHLEDQPNCDVDFSDDEEAEVSIPGFECKVIGVYAYERCDNTFNFYDFYFKFPENTECDLLKQYLDGLSEEQLEAFMNYVEAEGKRIILQKLADDNNWPDINDVTSYKSLCTQTCKWFDINCLAHHVIEKGPGNGRNNDSNETKLRGGGPCWKYGTIRCGDGCCVTKSTYVRDIDGKLVLSSANTVPYGDCQNGPEPVWPHYFDDCPPFSTIVISCHYKCD